MTAILLGWMEGGLVEVISDGPPVAAAEAGVKTITVPSTVVRKLRKPRTVTVGKAVSDVKLSATKAAASGSTG